MHAYSRPAASIFLRDRHRFGQIAGPVDVEAAQHGEVVTQQLQRDDVEDGLQASHGLGHLYQRRAVFGGVLLHVLVILRGQQQNRLAPYLEAARCIKAFM